MPAVCRSVRQAFNVHGRHAGIAEHVGRQTQREPRDFSQPVICGGVIVIEPFTVPVWHHCTSRTQRQINTETQRQRKTDIPKCIDERIHLHVIGGTRIAAHIADVTVVIDELRVS